MPESPQDKLNAAQREQQDLIDSHLTWFGTALEKLVTQWNEEIQALLEQLPSTYGNSRLQELFYLKQQIGSQLDRLGYVALAHQFLESYSESERAAQEQLAIVGLPSRRLSPLHQDALATLKRIDMDRIMRTSKDAIDMVSESIVLNALGGLKRSQMIANVEGVLGDFAKHTLAYVDTGRMAYERSVNWMTFSEVVKNWKYLGPNDIKTRPFCKAHVNKVYSTEDVEAMDNGTTLLPVRTYGGGYNCRHHFSPIVY